MSKCTKNGSWQKICPCCCDKCIDDVKDKVNKADTFDQKVESVRKYDNLLYWKKIEEKNEAIRKNRCEECDGGGTFAEDGFYGTNYVACSKCNGTGRKK